MKVFLIAGEVSGDRLGAALIDGLRQLFPTLQVLGVGGTEMTARGLQSLFPMEELSVMGIAEVLPRYLDLRRRMIETAEAVVAARPDVLITIDSPDFCLRVAKRVKAVADIPTVHYVAPSVWAWRPGRADKMAKSIDHVLALLPFEPPYMQAAGMSCDFVGHPVTTTALPDAQEIREARQALGLTGRTLCVLPGSRRSEIARLAPVFGAVAAQSGFDDIIVPAAPGAMPALEAEVAQWSVPARIVPPDGALPKLAVFGAADVALAASGTVSLELAAAGTPMVIAYDMAWLSRQIMRRLARIDTVTLVNLVSETRAVPECLMERCTPEHILAALRDVSADPSAQHHAMAQTMERLGAGGEAPGLRAARSVMAFLNARA